MSKGDPIGSLTFFISRLYSPSPEEGLGDEFDLIDHSDLHILDFSKYALPKVIWVLGAEAIVQRIGSHLACG